MALARGIADGLLETVSGLEHQAEQERARAEGLDELERRAVVAKAEVEQRRAALAACCAACFAATTATHLETPLEIGLLFRRVRAQVLEATNGEQRPHEYHSLVSEHYLTRTLPAGASVTVSAAVPAAPAPADPPRPDPAETDVAELPIAALRGLAQAGEAAAQTELGGRYEHAHGVEQDYGVAVSWFRRAAEQGHAPGQAAMGFLYGSGRGAAGRRRSGPVDPAGGRAGQRACPRIASASVTATASAWRRTTVKPCAVYSVPPSRDTPLAQNNLGVVYRDARGVEQDYREAVRWFRWSADQGHAGGQTNLGRMYATGRGVSRDDTEAVRWYRRAAEQGHALGQNNLGVMYERGRGVRRDRVEAVRWYRLAAQQGNALAQENLDRLR